MLTPEQIEIRRSGIGSSDVAALFGLAYDRRPIDVYLDKIGESEPWADNERTVRGSDLESMVLGWYHEDVGGPNWERPSTLRRTDRPWHMFTPDAMRGVRVHGPRPLLEDPIAGVLVAWPREMAEIKTHGWRAGRGYGEEGSDDVPDHIRIQTAWQASGAEVGVVNIVALIDTHLLRVFPCVRDLELEGYLLEEAESFWRNNVLERRPPDPDGSESFRRYIDQRWSGQVTEGVVELGIEATDEIVALADRHRETAAAAAAAKAEHEQAKQELQLALGPATRVCNGDRELVTWRRDKRGRPKHAEIITLLAERAGLAGELESIVNQHRSEPTRRLLVKGPK